MEILISLVEAFGTLRTVPTDKKRIGGEKMMRMRR